MLNNFLDHQNIQFSMKMERDGHHPSGQIFTGELMALWAIRYTVNLLIPTNTSALVLTDAGLSILVYRARALCDEDSLHVEMVYLRDIFRKNRQTGRTLDPPAKVALANDKPDSFASLPHIGSTFNHIN
jgi:hypothetical protein